jgi:DNA-directed RNA polymerase subunit RPC12/RpoP
MKAGSWLFLLASLLLVTATCTIGYAFLEHQKTLLLPALAGVILGLLLLVIYRMVSGGARCPLCMSPVLLSQRCQRNKNAKRLLGSYRFRVAKDIALKGAFRCPYCGEQTLCVARDRIRHH